MQKAVATLAAMALAACATQRSLAGSYAYRIAGTGGDFFEDGFIVLADAPLELSPHFRMYLNYRALAESGGATGCAVHSSGPLAGHAEIFRWDFGDTIRVVLVESDHARTVAVVGGWPDHPTGPVLAHAYALSDILEAQNHGLVGPPVDTVGILKAELAGPPDVAICNNAPGLDLQ
ncbi:MAG: hypothetical protein PVH96_11085 [Gemmatimonadota bacterium]|jgi:hypothetical protein